MSTITAISGGIPTSFILQYEKYNKEIESLIDKTSDFLANKGSDWVKEKLKNQEDYDKCIKSMNLFMPFISRSMDSLLKEVSKEMQLEEHEEKLFCDGDFKQKLKISLFNETFLGDKWHYEFNR